MSQEFGMDWESAKVLNRFGELYSWKINSIREYHSKKGIKIHVVLEWVDTGD